MKIGILTFHRSDSYGATLQSYAMLKALEALGCDAEFIDYVNPYEQQKHKPRSKGLKRILKNIKWKISSRLFRTESHLKRAFGNSSELYGNHITGRKYVSHEDLDTIEYDILLSASDQIWNPFITNGIDDAYLLAHGKAKSRISYASSMGSHILTEEEKPVYKKCLDAFDSISVREQFAKDELSKLTDKTIDVVCDPTMLLDREDWIAFSDKAAPLQEGKYAIGFFVGGYPPENMKCVTQAKKLYGVPVYCIQKNGRRRKPFDKCIPGVTVPEFVRYLRDAEYVITDSFHGAVLALILGRPLFPLINRSNPVRVTELMRSLGLEDSLNSSEPVDCKNVNAKLEEMREHGREWLKTAIEKGYGQH